MANDDENDDRVGYGKPPVETRFKEGQSGNPKGRPKGAKNVATLLDEESEESEESVVIRENSRVRKISKRRAIQVLLGETRALEARADPSRSEAALTGEDDEKVIQNLMQRLKGGGGNDGGSESGGI